MANAAAPTMTGGDLFGVSGLTVGGVGIWVALIAFAGKWLVQQVAMKKVTNEGDAGLRADLFSRINKLEADQLAERRSCDEKLAAMQETINGLVRQFLQFQRTTGHAIPLATKSAQIERALSKLDDIEGRP